LGASTPDRGAQKKRDVNQPAEGGKGERNIRAQRRGERFCKLKEGRTLQASKGIKKIKDRKIAGSDEPEEQLEETGKDKPPGEGRAPQSQNRVWGKERHALDQSPSEGQITGRKHRRDAAARGEKDRGKYPGLSVETTKPIRKTGVSTEIRIQDSLAAVLSAGGKGQKKIWTVTYISSRKKEGRAGHPSEKGGGVQHTDKNWA